jgi:hypothetical protein
MTRTPCDDECLMQSVYSQSGAGASLSLVLCVCCVLQVWSDGHKKARGDPNYLTLWKPVAPAGYVAMGLVASTGAREPPSMPQVGCRVGLVA